MNYLKQLESIDAELNRGNYEEVKNQICKYLDRLPTNRDRLNTRLKLVLSKHLKRLFETKNYEMVHFLLSKGADPGHIDFEYGWVLEYWIEIFEIPFDINNPYTQEDIEMLEYLLDNYPNLLLGKTPSPMYPTIMSWILKCDTYSGLISQVILTKESRVNNFIRIAKYHPLTFQRYTQSLSYLGNSSFQISESHKKLIDIVVDLQNTGI